MRAFYKTIVLIASDYTIACKLVNINYDIIQFSSWGG